MQNALIAFQQLLYDQLVPEFCGDPKRRCDPSTFNRASVRVSEHDAHYFLKAWEGGLLRHAGRGIYHASRGAAGEQFFWTGRNVPGARSFSLWLEPIITVAALARLHFDFEWPQDLIGTQSVDWSFDLVAFRPDMRDEWIAGEVKKTKGEVDQLLALMEAFGRDPSLPIPASGKARNAYKKVAGLRARRAPVFWAVGPDGLSKVYLAEYRDDDVIQLVEQANALHFDAR